MGKYSSSSGNAAALAAQERARAEAEAAARQEAITKIPPPTKSESIKQIQYGTQDDLKNRRGIESTVLASAPAMGSAKEDETMGSSALSEPFKRMKSFLIAGGYGRGNNKTFGNIFSK